MKPILKDKDASVKMIGGVVGILVTLMIAVLVFYNIAASIDSGDLDDTLQASSDDITSDATYAANATEDTLDQSSTFFTIAPIIAIVIVAVVILGYVTRIG